MAVDHDPVLAPRQRLEHWIEHLTHVLPGQAPIRDFVHHNTLHGFQHLPFEQALAAVSELTGAHPCWPEPRFRGALAEGRITAADLRATLLVGGLLSEDGSTVGGFSPVDIVLADLMAAPDLPEEATALLPQARRLTAAPAVAEDWRLLAAWRCRELFAELDGRRSLRSLLDYLSGEDVLAQVLGSVQRHLAAHLDLGMAVWSNPQQARGFYAAWRASAQRDAGWDLLDLPQMLGEIAALPDDPCTVVLAELARLGVALDAPDGDARAYALIERLCLELPGWSGMMLWRDRHPERSAGQPVAMIDYLAVRLFLERVLCEDLICRLCGANAACTTPADLQAYFAARPAEFYVRDAVHRRLLPEAVLHDTGRLLNDYGLPDARWVDLAEQIATVDRGEAENRARQLARLAHALSLTPADLAAWHSAQADHLLSAASRLDARQRGWVWLQAYERHYRESLFAALAANHARQQSTPPPSAQVVCCMDDREEGTRRHLEEIAPAIQTFGAAGFYGVAMYWQGLDDATRTALCPVVVTPQHLVRETARDAAAGARHAARLKRLSGWLERVQQQSRMGALSAPLFTFLAALPAALSLLGKSLFPAASGAWLAGWRRRWLGEVATDLALTAATPTVDPLPQAGFSDAEQVDRVAAFLRTIGLVGNFAPLVLMLGHGSTSENNPHRSAYDCGACSGRHGGPNARVFATMANRPEVRAGLAARGIVIPESCLFVAASHNTCDDGLEWFDLDRIPATHQAAFDTLLAQMTAACRAHAAERCRRLASAPPGLSPAAAEHHVRGRRHDISQARPELGHATNAAAFIGRRAMSRGLFLDRRVFLISYDPEIDDDGQIVESILLAAGPVGAGISLEYYFSTVNNAHFGCGSKVTHNLTGLFGVMEGAESDLRTGLPWQMVEIHEPMRLLVVVEQSTALLSAIVGRQPALQELIGNGWIVVASKDPQSGVLQLFCPQRGWLPWSPEAAAPLPQVARSADWFAGQREALPPALLNGATA